MAGLLPLQFFLCELGESIDDLGFIFLLLQHLVSLLNGHLVPMVIFFHYLAASDLILQTNLIKTHLLIVLFFQFDFMSLSSFLPCPLVLSNTIDLFL